MKKKSDFDETDDDDDFHLQDESVAANWIDSSDTEAETFSPPPVFKMLEGSSDSKSDSSEAPATLVTTLKRRPAKKERN